MRSVFSDVGRGATTTSVGFGRAGTVSAKVFLGSGF